MTLEFFRNGVCLPNRLLNLLPCSASMLISEPKTVAKRGTDSIKWKTFGSEINSNAEHGTWI